MVQEPLSPVAARRLIRAILATGEIRFTGHAMDEMAKDSLEEVDCVNALRGGSVGPGELENGTWRYQVHAGRTTVVVAFRSDAQLVVVTAWRDKR